MPKSREKTGKKAVSGANHGVSPELTPVSSGGNSAKKGKSPSKSKAKPKLKSPIAGNSQQDQLPPGTVSRTGQQPPADSGGLDPTKPIGKNNPPRSAQFKKGRSGNPKGYPKGQLQTKTILKYWLSQKEEIPNPFKPGETLKVKVIDTMTLGLINKARKGDVAAFREILDRTDGKPVQSNKIILPGGEKTMEITVGFKSPIPNPAPPADQKEEPQ